MTIVRGNWVNNSEGYSFFVWGEAWKSLVNLELASNEAGVLIYPFALPETELPNLLQEYAIDSATIKANWQTRSITIPTIVRGKGKKKQYLPIFAGDNLAEILQTDTVELYSWEIEGFTLTNDRSLDFLQEISLLALQSDRQDLGSDLRFWSHIYRWVLDLIVRQKFLPGIELSLNRSSWQPLLDSEIDLVRLAKFTRSMPQSCRVDLNNTEQEFLLKVLGIILDTRVRSWSNVNINFSKNISIGFWVQSLVASNSLLNIDAKNRDRIVHALNNWSLPIKEYLVNSENQNLAKNRYRLCLSLQPPNKQDNDLQGDWQLKYLLQALDEPNFTIDAATIWQCTGENLTINNRTIFRPQETLLKGLGLATRLYEPIKDSLENSQPEGCLLNPIQVYEFIRAIAWQLQNNGLGVILPSGLASGDNEQRLGIKITAGVNRGKGERLNLQSLLDYKLEIAVGNKIISKKDFSRLLAQKSPIVEIDGQWLALQPADVRSAQAVLDSSNEQMNLSVEDALRLTTGDTKVLAKLPVVKFESTGILQELINNLTDNKSVAAIDNISGFNGELRPYQAKGVGWLSFLETWGLGACLADDMGLGKCISPDTKIFINGNLKTAEAIWENYSQDTVFDGEGYWSQPTKALFVNSLNETTGKIVKGKVTNLYRQQISEKVKLITLQDGSQIMITKRHKLLTSNGWQNILAASDYVCVPAHLSYEGSRENIQLIEFVAWQIAEGYENNSRATLHISQKDVNVLYKLRTVILNIAKQYNLKVNRPQVIIPNNKRVPYLTVNSKAYQHFLESQGYQWGEKSNNKSIPSFIMQANLDGIKVFLKNYFDAEGSVIISMRSIEVSSASCLIIEQLAVLLRRFSIWLRVTKKQKRATNGTNIYRTYYIGTFGGNSARKFLEKIGFGNCQKQHKLEQICSKTTNTNIEGIPASEIVSQVINNTQLPIRHFGMHNTVYINGKQQFSNQSLTKVVASIDDILIGKTESTYRQLKPSKWTQKTLAAYKKIDRQYLEVVKNQLEVLLNREVYYCPIKSVQEIDYQGWVYDLEIAEYHNFVANNIICHNTVQTIGFLLNLKQQDILTKPTLLICPTSVINNWEREVKKFAPSLQVVIHHGDKRDKGKIFAKLVADKQLVITSYSLVDRDLKTLKEIDWQGVVLDEAQNIKNSSTKQSQAVRQLPAGFKIALTGTPVENRLGELWSILDFLNPDFLGTKSFFQKRFAMPIEKYGDRDSLNTLRSLVQPFILRRLKTDKNIIQDLPEKQEMNVFCGLSVEQAELYQTLVDESLTEIEDSEGIKRRGLILTLLLRLKQLCNHPELITAKTSKVAIQQPDFAIRSGKLLRLEEMLEEIIEEGDRALIFTQFSEWGKLIQPYLTTRLNSEILFLYGSTNRQARQEMVDRFQNDPNGPKIFILSLKAGGTGLNLTKANHVFHVDRWWNPAVENQATDRAFRIGQKRNVQVHKFICSGTLEEKINDIIESKKDLAEQTVNAGEQWLTDLDTNRLRNLLLLDRNAIIGE